MPQAVVAVFIAIIPCFIHAAGSACPFLARSGAPSDGVECPHELPPPLKPEGADVTGMGCTCASQCSGESIDVLFYSKCDWCWTKDGCGQYSIRGHWDYCVYPPMKMWEAQTHEEKLAQLWANTTAPGVVNKSAPVRSVASAVELALTESMITPFEDQWDVLPNARSKVIHGQGVVCQFALSVASTSPFTGILSPGNKAGLIRLGNALTIDEPNPLHDTPMFPGYGIKFLRTGVRSADWVGLRGTGVGGSWDFFNSTFTNHVPPDFALSAVQKFQQASGCIDMVGLSDACTYGQDGTKVAAPKFPFEIAFAPSGAVHFADRKKSSEQTLVELSSIPPGTKLFDVYTFASPSAMKADERVALGSLRTTSACVRSLFGDDELFFRHQRMEEDFALAPEWIKQMEALGDSNCHASPGPDSKWQCTPTPHELAPGLVEPSVAAF